MNNSRLEKLAITRAKRIRDRNSIPLGLVSALATLAFMSFIISIFLDGGMNSYLLLGLILLITALLHLERAGFKALLTERNSEHETD